MIVLPFDSLFCSSLQVVVSKTWTWKVNLIPVLSKADALNPEEMAELKLRILYQIQEANLKIYEFPELDEGE